MIYIYGDTDADNTASLVIDRIKGTLTDDNSSDGDSLLYVSNGQTGSIKAKAIEVDSGKYGVYCTSYLSDVAVLDSIINNTISRALSINTIRMQLIGNSINGGKGNGILVSGSSSVAVGSLESNLITGTYSIGIETTALFSSTIKGNKINSTGANANGMYLHVGSVVVVEGNQINITPASGSGSPSGLYLDEFWDSVIKGNSLYVNETDTTANHYGIRVSWRQQAGPSSRNVIAGNNINLVNNDAKDIGIAIASSCNNNQGGDNITVSVGTSISDAGTGNVVTAQDV